MSGTVLKPFADERSECDTSKGTIRFPDDAPLPPARVKRPGLARSTPALQMAGDRVVVRWPEGERNAVKTKRGEGCEVRIRLKNVGGGPAPSGVDPRCELGDTQRPRHPHSPA
jgi:hypothetical protein